ncbi:MAG TPA: amino acid adenylation domain-containing protein [Coleofasciculaceae cyanobacterium]
MSRNKEDLSTRTSKLSPAKRALLEARLRGNVGSNATAISRRSSTEPSPLSFAQQRLWFLQQLEPDNPFYNEHTALQLTGSLHIAALEQSLNAIVQRHEALRTTFEILDGQPVQRIASDLVIPLSTVDLRALPDAAPEIQRLAIAQSQCPFNLADAPLLRWTLLQLGEQEHVLLFTIHHIIFDGWSIDILIRELSAFYPAFSADQDAASLSALPIQYADFAAWQRQWLQGDTLESQLAYWQQQLVDAPSLLQLPTDRPRPSAQTYQGATVSFLLPQRLTKALKTIGKEAEATLFMTLLAAFNLLLYRYTGQADLIVGLPIANRNRAEIEGLIGMFVNSLVLRTNLSGNPTFEKLLGQVRQVMLGAYENQDLPFEKLVEALQPDRDAPYNPLFQVSFTLHNAPRKQFELPGLTITALDVERRRALLDLRLDMTETDQGLVGCWEYSTDLFDADRIRRMSGHFQTLLEAIALNPQQRISEFSCLTEAEHQQFLQWNQTQTDYPQVCIHQLFEAQVERTPDAIEIVSANQSLTYLELNHKANQLAHYLQTLGVGADVRVGICCDRSFDLAIGLLGILKAGGAYVPLDPDYPQERLEWMVSDSQMPILLTQSALVDRLPHHHAQGICLDSDWATIAQHSQENPHASADPSNLAYVIYTSGSTGKPKGVQIAHSSVVNFLASMQQKPGLTANDILLAVTSISFDIAGLELYLPLITGARLVLASRSAATDGKQLSDLLHSSGATLMQATPATWRMLLASGWQGKQDLKILCGGEALSRELAESLLEKAATVWNLYGPTETTVWSTVSCLEKGDRFPAILPIGRPIANTQIYLLDRQGQPVPVGVPGELHIGGVGLARGYLNRPELTADKFILHPTWDRIYQTGDLARYRSDGAIEYLGRMDHQVKLRGFRIELGEIEATLSQYPTVREAVMVAKEDPFGNKSLVAYIVPQGEVTIRELREFLQQQLPDYMVPSAFVSIAQLPLTPNGKVDRKALPEPGLEQLIRVSTDSTPSNPIEEMLVGIWTSVLGIDRVGIHDHFFELGGHSLLATQVISQIRQLFQIELPLRRLFELPTIAQLSQAIAATQTGLKAPPIQPRSTETVPLSFAQQRLWFLAQLEPDNPFYNLPIAVSLQGQLNLPALEQTLNEILRRHEALRTRVETQDGQAIAVVMPSTTLQISPVDLSELAEAQQADKVQQWVATEAQLPFDLGHDPLLRVSLLRLSEQDNILLLTLHHIAADGWSFGVLIHEVTVLYTAFCDGCPSPLPDLPIQYGDFAAWQRQWLQGDVLQAQTNYWCQQLQDALVLELPTDRPRPNLQTYRGNSYRFDLPPALLQALRRLSQQAGCTLFMTLLAAFKVLLGRYSNSKDIVVGTPIANRHHAEIEGLIGCFVNTLVLRTQLSENPTVLELLDRVRETALGGYAHQDLPFEQLVEALQLERSLSHTPLFQVMFVLHNAPLPAIALPNLTVTPLETDSGTAQFELTLSMVETAEGLSGKLEFNSDLFDPETIAHMAGHYQTLLDGMVDNPQQQISQLPLLTQAEYHQILVEWNDTQIEYLPEQCLHQLFEAQAQRTPDAVAVIFENDQLSYRELNARANQLAHFLQQRGVGAETLVGICLERSLEMVVGLLGVLKAGGAYVPLDPTYPQERLEWMLSDAQVSVLLTHAQVAKTLPDHPANRIALDADWRAIAQASDKNPASEVKPSHLAYVIYTSGSTGQPKGVMMSHRAICNHMHWMQSAFPLTDADIVLQKTPFSFDASIWEFYAPLLAGASLLMAQPGGHQDMTYLIKTIADHQVTTLQLVPSLLRMLLEQGGLETCRTLKRIFCGGEALSAALQKRLLASLEVEFFNLYGPTETCIDATYWTNKGSSAQQTLPIGRPIANAQAYILDNHLQPTPIGVSGELHIGGAGLARGYLNRPELTLEKFIANPFDPQPEARLYKTGDLARYLPNGDIEYLGRIDHQVKLRGFRIELGEIEAALSQYPAVRDTVVGVREIGHEQRLVAYVVTNPPQLSISDLRQFLKQKLPEYMIPAVFVSLEALSLLPNGKVDRNALPDPDLTRPELDPAFVAPCTAIEITLAEIWAPVLGVKQVGIHDNFFELGGDSILCIQVVARANQAGLKFTPKQMFEHQTIAELATVAGTKQGTSVEQGLVTGSVFLTPIQRWFFEQNLPDPHHFNQAVMLQLPQQIDLTLLEQALQQLLSHHDALRLRFERTESGWQQSYAPPDAAMLLIRWDFSALTAAAQNLALASAATEVQTSLNLFTGPLVRVGFFDLGEHQPHRLLIVIHHLVVDGVSWRILLEDLQTAYQQLSRGEAVQLPAKTTSFQQWSQTLRQYAHSALLQQEQDYWRVQPPFMPLPVDCPEGKNTVASADQMISTLSISDTQALLKEVPKAYHTEINDVLLTALVQAFAQWTGDRTLLIDLEGHGREDIASHVNVTDIDLSRTVGWFTTVFPVALKLEAATHPGDTLKSIKEQLRRIPRRGIGYGILRYCSDDPKITAALNNRSQPEVMFNYLGQFDQSLPNSSLFRPVQEPGEPTQSLQGDRSHLLAINCWISNEQLHLHWNYSQAIHHHSTIAALAQNFLQALRSLIAHCQSPEAGGYTPSDFSAANLSQQALDRFLTKIKRRN